MVESRVGGGCQRSTPCVTRNVINLWLKDWALRIAAANACSIARGPCASMIGGMSIKSRNFQCHQAVQAVVQQIFLFLLCKCCPLLSKISYNSKIA